RGEIHGRPRQPGDNSRSSVRGPLGVCSTARRPTGCNNLANRFAPLARVLYVAREPAQFRLHFLFPMKNRSLVLRPWFALTLLGIVVTTPGFAVELFDGKTLAGWEGDLKVWRVENGLITGGSMTEKVPRNFFLATTKSFQNFDLKLQIKLTG